MGQKIEQKFPSCQPKYDLSLDIVVVAINPPRPQIAAVKHKRDQRILIELSLLFEMVITPIVKFEINIIRNDIENGFIVNFFWWSSGV